MKNTNRTADSAEDIFGVNVNNTSAASGSTSRGRYLQQEQMNAKSHHACLLCVGYPHHCGKRNQHSPYESGSSPLISNNPKTISEVG